MADQTSTPSPLSLGPLSHEEMDRRWIGEEGSYMYDRALAASKKAAEKQEDLAKGFEKRRPQEEAETERAYAGAEKAMAQPRPAIPHSERVPDPPKPEDYHKMSMTYLGAMVLLGAFGGKFIRNSANAPLAAFNGALKGWQEGNVEAYKEKSEEWKSKQQQVLDNNRARLDEYRTILEDRSASIQDQMLRIKLVAAKHQDKAMYDRASADNWTGVAQAYDMGIKVQEKAVAATDKLVEQMTQVNETAVERANQWRDYLATPEGEHELATRYTPAQQFQIKGFVKTYADQAAPAQLPAPDNFGPGVATEPPPGTEIPAATAPTAQMPADLRSPMVEHDPKKAAFQQLRRETWAQHGREPSSDEISAAERKMHAPRSAAGMSLQEFIEERRAETGRDPSSGEITRFQARQAALIAGERTIGSRAASVEFAAAEFDRMMPIALHTSDAVARKKFVPYNQLLNNLRLMRSDPAYREFRNAVAGAITAYAGTMSRSGATTVHAQMRAEDVLGTVESNEAFRAGMKILKQEVDQVRQAGPDARKVIERVFGAEGLAPEEGGAGGAGEIRYFEGKPYRRGPNGEPVPVQE
jgi:hypothetical protein